MERRERNFALTISGAHGVDHLLKRVFPPLVPVWAVVFGFPLWKLGLLLGAQTFGSALGQTPMGHLSDRYDRRYMLPTGIAVIGLSFVVFAALPGLSMLDVEFTVVGTTVSGQLLAMVLTMVAVGIGSSTLHPTGYPLISQNVSADHKGKVLGMWGSARAFGDGTAPALVGVALLVTDWRTILVGFGTLGVAYAVYLLFVLKRYETRPANHVGGTRSGGDDQRSVWKGDRRRYVYPMLAVFVAFVLQLVATAGATAFLPQFITTQYGFSFSLLGFDVTPASTASFYYSALLLTAGVVQLGTGALVDRYDHRTVLICFLVASTLVLTLFSTLTFSPLVLFVVLLSLGTTLWGLNPARDAIVSDISPPEREGRTFGYLWTGGLLAASGSPAVVGYIGDVAGLRQAFLIIAGVVLLSAVPVALLLSEWIYVESSEHDALNAD